MTPDQRTAFAAIALVDWAPEYPDQPPPKLVVWFAGEDEGDLSGFHSRADRDGFHRGESGPFLRRVTGRTFRQMPFREIESKESSDV